MLWMQIDLIYCSMCSLQIWFKITQGKLKALGKYTARHTFSRFSDTYIIYTVKTSGF